MADAQTIIKKGAFIHLAYEYRLLAQAAYGWNNFGDPKNNNSQKIEMNNNIPEIGSIIQDSLHMHTRVLIDFYLPKTHTKDTDITIESFIGDKDFSSKERKDELNKIRNQIEVHSLHITLWRDKEYRSSQVDMNRQRPDWNELNGSLFTKMLELLSGLIDELSPDDPWKSDLADLHKATLSRFDKGSRFNWPNSLTTQAQDG